MYRLRLPRSPAREAYARQQTAPAASEENFTGAPYATLLLWCRGAIAARGRQVWHVFNRSPPYTNYASITNNFVGGYDLSYGDPRDRYFYATIEYSLE